MTGALLVPLLSSHVAVARTDRIAVSATDATVLDGGDSVRLDLRVDNPTPAPVTVPERASGSGLVLFVDGDRFSRSRGLEIGGVRVPAGGSATLTLTVSVADAHRPATRANVAGAELSGSLPIEVTGYEAAVDVETTVGAA